MPKKPQELESFVQDCIVEYHSGAYVEGATRFDSQALYSLMTVLVFQGMIICLPLLQAWIETGVTAAELKRQQIEQKLQAFALEKELDYEAAQKAAKAVANRLTENNIRTIFDALKAYAGAK